MSWGRPGWADSQFSEKSGDDFCTDGLAGNQNFRFYLQMAWKVHDSLGGKNTVADYDDSDLDAVQKAIDASRKVVEAWADALNKKHGKQVFFLVPVGDAVTQLRRMIVAGKVLGVTKQSAVWSDAMPHAGPLAAELGAYCNYAAIYRRSPEGLDVKESVPAERPGVANVTYFTDGAGRDAVLVTVSVDRKPWSHVLVYDKDHRRASVTKQPAPPEPK